MDAPRARAANYASSSRVRLDYSNCESKHDIAAEGDDRHRYTEAGPERITMMCDDTSEWTAASDGATQSRRLIDLRAHCEWQSQMLLSQRAGLSGKGAATAMSVCLCLCMFASVEINAINIEMSSLRRGLR